MNATSHDGLICPEVAEWTCNVTTSDSQVHFYLGNSSNVNATKITEEFFANLNLTIYYIDNEPMFHGPNAIRTMVINNKELHDRGYLLLLCGTFFVKATHPLRLDMEGMNLALLHSKVIINVLHTFSS